MKEGLAEVIEHLRSWEPDQPDPIGPLRGAGYLAGLSDAADLIDAAMPKWTDITDNPDTWPDDGEQIFYRFWAHDFWVAPQYWEFNKASHELHGQLHGCCWRPLCGFDFPPKKRK